MRLDRFGRVTQIESLQTAMRRMRNSYFSCVQETLLLARSDDEMFDMMMISSDAVAWLRRCCAQLESVGPQ